MTYLANLKNNLLPGTDDGYSLGSPSLRWKDGYFANNSLHVMSTVAETGFNTDWNFSVIQDGYLSINNISDGYFTITRFGNVGIGTTHPSQKLSVDGYIRANPGIIFGDNSVMTTASSGSGGGTITGSGTANQLTYWTDSTAIGGDTNLIWDATNDRLAVGQTSATARLDVSNGGSTDSVIIARDNTTVIMSLADGGNLALGTAGTAGNIFDINQSQNSALGMFITNSNAGNASRTHYGLQNDQAAGFTNWELHSSGWTTSGLSIANQFFFNTGADITGGVLFLTQASAPYRFVTNSDIPSSASNERLTIGSSELAINESGANYDFRVEGDSKTNLFFVDASADKIGIGTATPSFDLHLVVNLDAAGASTIATQNLANGTSSSSTFVLLNQDSTVNAQYAINNGGYAPSQLNLPNQLAIGTNGNNGVLIYASGGTGAPIVLSTGSGSGNTSDNERLRITGTEVAFNDNAQNVDLRVESDGETHALFLDASLDSGHGRWGFFDSSPDAIVDIEGGTLANAIPAFGITATLEATTGSNSRHGADFTFTSSGNDGSQLGTAIVMNAGYTGARTATSLEVVTASAGVGNNLNLSTSFAEPFGNSAINGFATGTTTGANFGSWSEAANGNLNIGVGGKATTVKSGGANIGVVGFALNTVEADGYVGGYFGLQNTTPTFTSVALMADNGSTNSDIFAARDDGYVVFAIEDGGQVRHNKIAIVSYLATTNLDFKLTKYEKIDLAGNITFTTSNLAPGRTINLKILCDGTPRNFTFPGWIFLGTAPTTIAAGKTAVLSLTSYGTIDADVVATYVEQA